MAQKGKQADKRRRNIKQAHADKAYIRGYLAYTAVEAAKKTT